MHKKASSPHLIVSLMLISLTACGGGRSIRIAVEEYKVQGEGYV
jgi:hypothetical protein